MNTYKQLPTYYLKIVPKTILLEVSQKIKLERIKKELQKKYKGLFNFCNSTFMLFKKYFFNRDFLIGLLGAYIILTSISTRPAFAVGYIRNNVKNNKRSWKQWFSQKYNKMAQTFPSIRKLEKVDYELLGYGILLLGASCYILYDEMYPYLYPDTSSFTDRITSLGLDPLPDKKIPHYGNMISYARKLYNWATQDADTQQILFLSRTSPDY